VKSCLCLRKCACAQTRANGTRHVMSRHLVMRTHHAMSTHQTSQPCRQPHQRPFPCRAPLPEASRHRCRASCCVYVCACVSPRLRHGLLTLHGRAGALCTLHCTRCIMHPSHPGQRMLVCARMHVECNLWLQLPCMQGWALGGRVGNKVALRQWCIVSAIMSRCAL